MKKVIAIFDIGKTNKKLLLFDEDLKLIQLQEQPFEEITDEEGFPCDDISAIETWIISITKNLSLIYEIIAINFTTYGATLVYLDENGNRVTPLYNYLKPLPEDVLDNFYERYGDSKEFLRKTASPKLGMLNSGLQILWLKNKKPEVYAKVKNILHFPQYLSYLFTKKIASEYTSIGCHTALWDFDNNTYHRWVSDENINLVAPTSNFDFFTVMLNDKPTLIGTGFHDSSASLIPYLIDHSEKFILISTGTWSIFMNPFNEEKLTSDQLEKDTLCFLSVQQKQVKSSRLFMGHIHKKIAEKLSEYFQKPKDHYQFVKAAPSIFEDLLAKNKANVFFPNGVSENADECISDLEQFDSFEEAYHQLNIDLIKLAKERIEIISGDNDSTAIYITGGFSRNELYTRLLATEFPDKTIYTSEIDNATALGAALITRNALKNEQNYSSNTIDLGIRKVFPFEFKMTI